MGILNIAPAERAGAHLLIQLYGPPRSGKTYTALRIARGMVGPEGRIGVLDTESGRARLYSDKVAGGFVVGELTPPREHARPSARHSECQVKLRACSRLDAACRPPPFRVSACPSTRGRTRYQSYPASSPATERARPCALVVPFKAETFP
jgi:hypothetical protein